MFGNGLYLENNVASFYMNNIFAFAVKQGYTLI